FGAQIDERARCLGSVARALPTREKFTRFERTLAQRATRRTHRDTKVKARIRKLLERVKAREELAAQRGVDDRARETVLGDEHLAMQPSRRHRAQERAAERVVIGHPFPPE